MLNSVWGGFNHNIQHTPGQTQAQTLDMHTHTHNTYGRAHTFRIMAMHKVMHLQTYTLIYMHIRMFAILEIPVD